MASKSTHAVDEAGLTREIADTLDSINEKLAELLQEHREQAKEVREWLATLHAAIGELER